MQVNTDGFIDQRNQPLWDMLNATFTITIEPSTNDEYHVYSENSDCTIYVPPHDICADSFTHELLHIYLRHKQIFIGTGFRMTISGSNFLNTILSDKLQEHFGNCLDHIKMYPLYEQMGFSPDKFLYDFNTHKCSPAELKDIKRYYKQNGIYNKQAVDLFIGKYIAMMADFNPAFDYEEALDTLFGIDPLLYTTLDKFIEQWEAFDIESDDPLLNSYHILLHDFYQGLKAWLNGKRFSA